MGEFIFNTAKPLCEARKFLIGMLMSVVLSSAFSQLDSIHWIPPLTATDFGSSAGAYEHVVYLSTQEAVPFDVTVTTGTGTLIGTYSVSNASAYKMNLSIGSNYLCLPHDSVGYVQQDDGLIFTASKKFYANYRVRSNAQGGSLTAKGRIARGRDFRWGGVPNYGNSSLMNGVMGIMAMEDNTTVTIDDYDPDCEFRLGAANNGITSNSVVVTLDAGETYVLECVNTVHAANSDGWIGAHVSSDKDIVMNNGNLMGGTVTGSASRDICIDQTLPIERLGTEYITLRGNGLTDTELVVVVASQDNTDISVNGGGTVATIHRGDHYVLDGSNYTAQSNMYIETSEDAYVFQVLAGSTNKKTIGLNFIPPLSCMLPLFVDNIADIEQINTTNYTGGVSLLTRAGATVLINGSPPASSPQVVTGTSDWVTYLETGLTGDVSLVSDEPMAAGMFGANNNAGFAGYFSGFSERPEATITADNACAPAVLTLQNTGVASQWHFNDALQSGDTLQTFNAISHGSYYTVVGVGSCTDTSNTIIISCHELPVELVHFDYQCDENSPFLSWKTNTENQSDYFELWSSDDGKEFEWLGKVDAGGTAWEPQDYRFDIELNREVKYYQLSQTDLNGEVEYFSIVSNIKCKDYSAHLIQGIDRIHLLKNDIAEVSIVNQMGRPVINKSSDFAHVYTGDLNQGIYFIQIRYNTGIVHVERIFVK